MSSHPTHRQDSRKNKHHKPLQRGAVSGTFPVEQAHRLADALRRALDELEAERLQTARLDNASDDEEDPTRRGGPRSIR